MIARQTPNFAVTYDDEKHKKHGIDGEPAESVTQVISGTSPMRWAPWYGQGVGVRGVCELVKSGEYELDWKDPDGIVDLLTSHKLTVNHVRDAGGDKGNAVHAALEEWAKNQSVPNPQVFSDETRGYVRAVAGFLVDKEPEFIETEVVVGSKQYGYVGKYDARARIDGKLIMPDYKTSKAIYPREHFPQVAAYEAASIECGDEPTDEQWIVRFGADGEYEVRKSHATIAHFLPKLYAYRADATLNEAEKKIQRIVRAEAKQRKKQAAKALGHRREAR